MQGRAWYGVLAGWLLTAAGILGIVYGLFGLVVTLWAAGIGYHTPGFSLVHNAILVGAGFAISCGSVVGRTTSQTGRRGVTEEHMIAAIYARLLLATGSPEGALRERIDRLVGGIEGFFQRVERAEGAPER
jgi:hypothetical protein